MVRILIMLPCAPLYARCNARYNILHTMLDSMPTYDTLCNASLWFHNRTIHYGTCHVNHLRFTVFSLWLIERLLHHMIGCISITKEIYGGYAKEN